MGRTWKRTEGTVTDQAIDGAIRDLRSADLAALLDLYEHLHRSDDARPTMRVVEATWRELIESQNSLCVGGFESGRLLSSCVLTVIPNLTRGCRPYGLIENVVTRRDHRNKGWGKRVLSCALDAGWRRGCYKIMLMTGRQDEAIARFYASAGFDGDEKHAYVARPKAGRTS